MWHHPKVLDHLCRVPYNAAIVKVLVGSFRLLLQQTFLNYGLDAAFFHSILKDKWCVKLSSVEFAHGTSFRLQEECTVLTS